MALSGNEHDLLRNNIMEAGVGMAVHDHAMERRGLCGWTDEPRFSSWIGRRSLRRPGED